jgi:hypothetical protein
LVGSAQYQLEEKSNAAIRTREALKEAMRRRFVPYHYIMELHQKVHRLVEGGRSAEDYHKEKEMCTVRVNIEKDEEVTIARFLGWLNVQVNQGMMVCAHRHLLYMGVMMMNTRETHIALEGADCIP